MNAEEVHELLKKRTEIRALDIRTPEEFKEGHLTGALNVDYYAKDFKEELAKLDREQPYLLYCRTGRRTTDALPLFEELGFKEIIHLHTGIVDWKSKKFPLQSG